jgi:beta-lactamase class C
VIVVVRHDGLTQFFPFGLADREHRTPVTADTVFELASITKVFTTTSLAMEVQAGRMQLDDVVTDYVPLLRDHGGDIRRVTLLQLATHTSSLPRTPTVQRPDHDWNKQLLIQWLAGWQSPYPPGTKSLYSNIGVGLLGFAIADLEKKPMIDIWREQFLTPLGMHRTFFEPRDATPFVAQGYGPHGQPVSHTPVGGWPAGGRLSSSGRDMGNFLVANMGERTDLPKIMAAMQFSQRPFFKASANMTQGLAWQRVHIQGELVIDKNGGLTGTSTYIGMLPERHVGVVVMANRGKCQATAVGRQLLIALVAKQQTE